MVEEKKTVKRKKPKFLRTDWHKKIRLGRGVKKNQKWHGAKGRQNKLRLGRKGRMQRPKIGWGAERDVKEISVKIMNVKDLAGVKKGSGIVIGAVGMKKRKEIIAEANKAGVKVLNRYLVKRGNEPRTNADERGLEGNKKLEDKSKGTPLDSLRHQTGQGGKK